MKEINPKHFERSAWTNERTQYKNVFKRVKRNEDIEPLYEIRIHLKGYQNAMKKVFEDEREAAKAVDLYLLSKGREPVNILKRKQ